MNAVYWNLEFKGQKDKRINGEADKREDKKKAG